jgi:hypothetical protein
MIYAMAAGAVGTVAQVDKYHRDMPILVERLQEVIDQQEAVA